MQSAAAAAKKHNRKAPKKNRQRMSKKQKLLRKRVEAEKLKAEDLEEDDSKVDVKVKYSVNYLYWAVNNSDDDDDEDEESEVETTVVLPLKSLRLKSWYIKYTFTTIPPYKVETSYNEKPIIAMIDQMLPHTKKDQNVTKNRPKKIFNQFIKPVKPIDKNTLYNCMGATILQKSFATYYRITFIFDPFYYLRWIFEPNIILTLRIRVTFSKLFQPNWYSITYLGILCGHHVLL